MPERKLPTSRIARTTKIGSLVVGQAAKRLGTKALNVGRSQEASDQKLIQRQLDMADEIVDVLGSMKGAAMKIGQVLSFLDLGLVSEDARDHFQQRLSDLRDSAPAVDFKQVHKLIESEMQAPLKAVFSEFDTEPIAAASIGQVYRAKTVEGEQVAVKVQYPGIDSAVRVDLQNLGLILRLVKTIAPGLDPRAVSHEIKERIGEELDYELEAQNQRSLYRIYRGHPFIYIPKVYPELSTRRVLVSEFVEGEDFDAVKARSQQERNRIGEIAFRFFFGSLYRHRQFSADPHPGNLLLMEDGRVAFIDFGLFKYVEADTVEFELQTQRFAMEGDADGVLSQFLSGGFIPSADGFSAELLLKQFEAATWWYSTSAGPLELTAQIAQEISISMSDPRSEFFDQMRKQTIPSEHLLGRRMEMLTLGVLAQLEAKADWNAVAREWVYGSTAETELGQLEAKFYSR